MQVSHAARYWTITALISLGLCTSLSHAQVDESVLAAAYIYNITQFTTWPAGALPDSKLLTCVSGQSSLGVELGKLAGKSAGGHSWAVAPLASNDNLAKCNVIVLEKDTSISKALADNLASDRPALVISTFDMGSRPWVVRLFTEDSHIRFDIDRTEAVRRHLSLSSRLLSLARNVL